MDASSHLFKVCCHLVGFDLADDEIVSLLTEWDAGNPCGPYPEKEYRRKINEARTKGHIAPGSKLETTRGEKATEAEDENEPDATAADILAAGAGLAWAWQDWIPLSMLSTLAADAGCGKTRFCCDLARRIWHGLPWPDGSPATFAPGSKTLWVPADGQQSQLAALAIEMKFPPESIVFNAKRANMYGGTMLDRLEELAPFERRILRVKPAIVFIDTSVNATDRGCSRPEDAKAFFVPLIQIAQRTGTPIICLTHVNSNGKALGLRIRAQSRSVMELTKPDPGQGDRRKLRVEKSIAKIPPPLGVTMKEGGNDYDLDPPEEPEEQEPGKVRVSRLDEMAEWLRKRLEQGAVRVSVLRREAEDAGFSSRTFYAARKQARIEEYEENGKVMWRLETPFPE